MIDPSADPPLFQLDLEVNPLSQLSLSPVSTLDDLPRFSVCVNSSTIGSVIALEFESDSHLPGVIILDQRSISMISRRAFLERLSQPYGLELFLKRPIRAFLAINILAPPLILPGTERIDRAAQFALQRSNLEIYDPIVVRELDGHFSLLDFQTLLLAQAKILTLQKEALAAQAKEIETLNSQLSWQASHDPLTHLVNRRAFEKQLENALSDLKNRSGSHVLCYIDLDRFKTVNDSCGHLAGDELLKQVAQLMRNGVRNTDTVGRLGGDEFGIILHRCNLESGQNLANLLCQSLEDLHFVWEKKVFRIGASIGLVLMDDPGADLREILRAADNACYIAKKRERNRIYVCTKNDREPIKETTPVNSLGHLQAAIENNCFDLYIQPIVSLLNPDQTDHSIAAYEVLLRVKDSNGQMISPVSLIATAERHKLMHKIDRWVIQHLFDFLTSAQSNLLSSDIKPFYMINLSRETLLDEEFPDFVKEKIKAAKVSPHFIGFEITETVAITHFNQASKFIQNLREFGCYFALDDFGCGMSSFTYLKHFDINFLKIDAIFMRDLATDTINKSIVKAIHQVGHAMGLKTIAEGIEDPQTLPILQNLGIEYAQGYAIFSPYPLKASNFLKPSDLVSQSSLR